MSEVKPIQIQIRKIIQLLYRIMNELYETSTNKLHGTVVGKEFLHTDAPVMPGLQGSRAALRCTQVTGPWVHIFQPVECPLTY